jgi:hypothetical protein
MKLVALLIFSRLRKYFTLPMITCYSVGSEMSIHFAKHYKISGREGLSDRVRVF